MTFVEQYLAGQVELDDIDVFVERWHTEPEGEGISLHDYLGMTWAEYSCWVMNPNSLEDICEIYRK